MITSVYIDTDELVFQLHSVSDDAQKALEWVRSFRDTLMFGARIPNPLPFAMECMAMSEGFSASGVLGKLRAAARKRLNDEGIEATPESIDAEIARTQGADAVREIMAKIERANRLKAEIRRRKFTAAATTSDGVDVIPSSESCRSVRTTGCNISQVVPTRKAGNESSDARKGAALKSATACNQFTADGDIREDSRNVTDGSNAGTLESCTSANHYDQETKVSTNSPAGAGVNFDSTHTISPDASSGNAEGVNTNGMPITRNGSRATRTSATSGQTITTAETLDKAGAGEVPPENVSKKPSPALPVPAKRPHGEFGNVMLTDDEFSKLCDKCPDADALITELDQYIESQGKTKKYKSHYATLLNWSRRKAQEAKPQQRYKNINDINQENYEKAMREIEAMCAGEAI